MSVKLVCKLIGVSRSGFYAWRDRGVSTRQNLNEVLLTEIKEIHSDSRGTYGLPRIMAKLKSMGKRHGKSKVEKLMKRAEISGLIKKRFKVRTTDSDHKNPIAERVFKTEETATHPQGANQVWASDISYIPTEEGVLFLAIYLDLYTRKIVGFSTDDTMETRLILSALEMALGRQGLMDTHLVNHSDRGSQYASELYRERLKSLKIVASMSRKGNCYDNAYAESFFATLKKELTYRKKFKTQEEAKKAIFEYIEVWYNRNRIHSSIGYRTPVQFEESLAA